MTSLRKTICLIAGLLLAVGVPQAFGTVYTLTSGNSTANIDPSSQNGMSNWTVDNTSILYQQWFWYRIGNANQASIDTVLITSEVQPLPNILNLVYTAANLFEITVTYTLHGGQAGTGIADIAESITINNKSGQDLDFHFFQYSDFDLSPNNDLVSILNGGQLVQQKPTLGTGPLLTETVATPPPSHFEAALAPNTVNALNGPAYTLNDVASIGPGDATWALQWDKLMGANGSLIISKDKLVGPVPEPTTVLMLGGVLLLVGNRLRRRWV